MDVHVHDACGRGRGRVCAHVRNGARVCMNVRSRVYECSWDLVLASFVEVERAPDSAPQIKDFWKVDRIFGQGFHNNCKTCPRGFYSLGLGALLDVLVGLLGFWGHSQEALRYLSGWLPRPCLSWSILAASWRPLGPVLAPCSWLLLAPSSPHPGAIFAPSWPILS